jgi:hypothetical protein
VLEEEVVVVIVFKDCDTVVDSGDAVVDGCDTVDVTVDDGCNTVVERSINARAASVTGEDGKSGGGRMDGNGEVTDDALDVFDKLDEIPIRS